MAVVYNTTLKNNRLQLVSDLTAAKTAASATGTASAGQLVIGTSALSGATGVLVTIPLPTIPFTISGGVATLQGTPLSAVATGAGTAALAEFRNNAGSPVISGLTVGTSLSNIILPTLTIFVGGTLTVTGGTITENGAGFTGTPTYYLYGF